MLSVGLSGGTKDDPPGVLSGVLKCWLLYWPGLNGVFAGIEDTDRGDGTSWRGVLVKPMEIREFPRPEFLMCCSPPRCGSEDGIPGKGELGARLPGVEIGGREARRRSRWSLYHAISCCCTWTFFRRVLFSSCSFCISRLAESYLGIKRRRYPKSRSR